MLGEEIEAAKRTVNTDTVQITLGEVANMYQSGELNVFPEFQRLFRWTPDRKSNFIESIFIGIPIPPAFVYENSDGTWELIDGLQRLSTVLEFMGILKDPNSDSFLRSKLQNTKYLPSLRNVVWQKTGQDEVELDRSLQLFFRRHRFDFQVLKHPSDPATKYDLFQRLNRGGAYANEQEVRTCAMVLTDRSSTQKIRDFADREDFASIFRVTSEQRKNQTDIEYVVRLIVHMCRTFPQGSDVQEFLSRSIIEILASEDIDPMLARLGRCVEMLSRCLGEKALIPPDNAPPGIAQRFSLRALEGIAVGLARNYDAIIHTPSPDEYIKSRVYEFWSQPEVADMSAPGLRGSVRIQRSVPFGATWFNPNAAA